ncbi:MAG: ATP-binding protein [Pseudomonadota bacterium]
MSQQPGMDGSAGTWTQAAIDQVALNEGLRRLLVGLTVLFVVFPVLDGVTLSGTAALVVCTLDVTLAIVFGAGLLWLRRRRSPVQHPHPWLAACALLTAASSLLTYTMAPDIYLTGYLLMIVVATGSFMLSWRWTLATIALVLGAGWGVIGRTLGPQDTAQWGFLMLAALAMALSILLARRGVLRRVALLSREVEARVRSQEATLQQLEAELTERRIAEEKLQAERDAAEQMVETAPAVVLLLGLDGRLLRANSRLGQLTGVPVEQVLGQNFFGRFMPGSPPALGADWCGHMHTEHGDRPAVAPVTCADGAQRQVEWHCSDLRTRSGERTGVLAVGQDITARLQAERAAEDAREQMLQAQKMEAVGQLAGGVAHDFNNLLCVMLSATGFALDALPADHPVRQDLRDVMHASQHAASLTRQLLAFSRRQILQPAVLDLNDLVRNLSKMLGRLLGENIAIELQLGSELGAISADPGQLEQVLLNLSVNARDAMPAGGTLTIETHAVELDPEQAARFPGMKPGRYVRLCVRDSGCGMDLATQRRLFEPFFTTKPPGKGTGLGLSTVFGIVKQSNGHIRVHSEPGRGTGFEIDLPAVDGAPLQHGASPSEGGQGGNATVLLVEDDPQLRRMAERILKKAGYLVLSAADGSAALQLYQSQAPSIDLMLTDVVMPGMSGKQLADQLLALHPGFRVLFMSGYTGDAIAHHGILEPGIRFLPKPFSGEQLLRAVREALDAPA